ncbi:MAG: NDP-hexose 4-ketoreductase, partial [Candidatus Eremiobacteraeota bacterium]|nr:NDP-hexose 4-ketoreductase [Candidatus Eremiobacteraeota bacterium]
MSEPFAESARQSMVFAQKEAQRLGDRDIHTRHLLLGILAEANSVAARALQHSGVTLDAVRAQADKDVRSAVGIVGETRFSPRSKRIIELAFAEARTFSHDCVGAEHLALALLNENDGSAAELLTALHADRDAVRAEIMRNIQS